MNSYKPITQNSLIENTRAGTDLYIKSCANGVPRYVLFCRGDEAFSNKRKEELIRRNIKLLYTPERSFRGYVTSRGKNLKTIIVNKKRCSEEKSSLVYHVAKYLVKDLLCNPGSGIIINGVKDWVDNTVYYILQDKNAFSCLLKIIAHDSKTYIHSVNITVLGLLFGKHLALDQHSLNCLGLGMLLHDLGKVEIPLEILNKPGKLSKHEYEIAKMHPENGLKCLEERENIPKESLDVVIQHHENYDGTGYPNGIGRRDIHLFGRISRIIDVYDAINTNKPYKTAKRPFHALAEMREKMLNCFDKELFKEFIQFLGSMDSCRKRRVGGISFYNPKFCKNHLN